MADAPMDPHTQAIAGLHGDVSHIRGDITGIRGDITIMRSDISGLRREMNERFEHVDQRFDHLRVLIESVQSDVRLILEHLAPTMTQVADHDRRISKLEQRKR